MTPIEEQIWASAYGCAFVAVLTRLRDPSDALAQAEAATYAKSVAEAALGLSGKATTRIVLPTPVEAAKVGDYADTVADRMAGR